MSLGSRLRLTSEEEIEKKFNQKREELDRKREQALKALQEARQAEAARLAEQTRLAQEREQAKARKAEARREREEARQEALKLLEAARLEEALNRKILGQEMTKFRSGKLGTKALDAVGTVFDTPRLENESDTAFNIRLLKKIETTLPENFRIYGEQFGRDFKVMNLVAFACVALALMVESKHRTGKYNNVMTLLQGYGRAKTTAICTPREFYAALSVCLLAIVGANGVTVSVVRFFRKLIANIRQKTRDSTLASKWKAAYGRDVDWKSAPEHSEEYHHGIFVRLFTSLVRGAWRGVRSVVGGVVGAMTSRKSSGVEEEEEEEEEEKEANALLDQKLFDNEDPHEENDEDSDSNVELQGSK